MAPGVVSSDIIPVWLVMNNGLFSTAYFPPLEYFAAIIKCDKVFLEAYEIFQKQSYRTRCHIYSADGLFVLNIPVCRDSAAGEKPSHKIPITKIAIDYSEPWVQQHKRALIAAYGNSPFFEYYCDEIFEVLDSFPVSLFELNLSLLKLIIGFIGNIKCDLFMTTSYVKNADIEANVIDFRDSIHPKSKEKSIIYRQIMEKPYFQVFSQKQGFIPNLSIVDLLFNEGPNSISFLR